MLGNNMLGKIEFSRVGLRFCALLFAITFFSTSFSTRSLALEEPALEEPALEELAIQENDTDKPTVLLRGIVVNEAGEPVLGAVVETMKVGDRLPKVSTKTVAGGAFLLRFPSDAYYGASILVRDETKQLAGYISGYEYTSVSQNIFRVTLKPLRQTEVTVVDQAGQPIADATVRLLVDYADLQTGQTDGQGQIRLSFPDGSPVNWIVAYKDDCGFDYFENATSFLLNNKADVPNQIRLTLNGATTMRVNVVDSNDQPVAGVPVTPWTIQKVGKRDDANISGLNLGKSDANGIAEFRFMPQDVSSGISFLLHDDQYHCPDLAYIAVGDKTGEAVAKVYKLVTIRGKVTREDGSPAAGIRLQGEGRGATNMYFRGHTSTKADGTYEFRIYPDQATLIAVTDEHMAAESIEIPAMLEGKVRENVDMKLVKGFVVSGKFTHGPDRQPARDQTATLIQKAKNGAELVRWSQSDKNGRYRFRVGPGSYSIRLLDESTSTIEVADEDIELDSHVQRLPRGPLAGKVVDGDGAPVSAFIVGESINAGSHAGFKVQCNADGAFETEKWNDKLRVIAVSAEKRLFGTREIDADAEQTEIVLAPAASLECSVVDEEGKPLERCRITAHRNWAGTRLAIEGQTDEEGKCTFAALGPGMTWTISASRVDAGTTSVDFEVGEAKRYVVPTLKMKIAEAKEE